MGLCCSALPACEGRSPPADPLVGEWKLDRVRTHYSPNAEPRAEETFACVPQRARTSCVITSLRADGRPIVGTFAAAYDGRRYAVTGVRGMDQVSLRRVAPLVVDATFSYAGRPVFAYRASRSEGGERLTVVSVDPVTRRALESVVVYERR